MASDPSAFPMEGGCCCGHIRYRLERAPIAVHCCHCTSCQRETGSAFGINVIIEATHLTLLEPAPPTLPSHSCAPDAFLPAGPPLPASASDSKELDLLRTPIPQESGEPQHVSRCARCFTAVWTEYTVGPAVRFVRGGTLDRAWLVKPDLHLFVRSKRDFVRLEEDGVPRFEEFYDREAVWSEESLGRWRALVPEIQKFRESVRRGEGTA